MPLYSLIEEPEDLVAPVLIVSLSDWVDAGEAGSSAARRIADGGTVVAEFDTDALFDYRSHRPILDIVGGIPQRFEWPRLTMTWRHLPERDLFVLSGSEPDSHWKEFAGDILELALRFGIIEHVSLGAVPAAVPHTAPTPIMMTGSSKELLGEAGMEGLLRVPAAAVSLIEWTIAESGIPAVGFWAQVPHYASPYSPAAIALIRRVETHLSVALGAGELEEEAAMQIAGLNEAISDSPESRAYVERLESLMGEEEVPLAENIGEEVERFLRTQRRGDPGPNPFSP
jgi:hypothetical protein